MTPSIDSDARASTLRAKLHRIIDEVFAATSENTEPRSFPTDDHERAQLILARLRHLEPALDDTPEESSIKVGELTIDLAGHEVFSAGRRIRLTHREFALLRFLAKNRGRACTREELVVHVWTERDLTSARTVDIHIHRLRHKLGRPFAELLETLRNVGYKLRTAPWSTDTGGRAREQSKALRLRRTASDVVSSTVLELETRHPFQEQPVNPTASLGQSP